MDPLNIIRGLLASAVSRWRVRRSWMAAWSGLFAGSILWLAVLSLFKIVPLSSRLLLLAGGLAAVLPLVAAMFAAIKKISDRDMAVWIDQQNNLKERLSTALELSERHGDAPWTQLVVRDAAAEVRQVNIKSLLPLKIPRVARFVVLALALALGLGFVPEYRSKKYIQREKEVSVIRDTGQQLMRITKRELANLATPGEETRQALESVGQLGVDWAKPFITRDAALKDLARATDTLRDGLKDLAKNPSITSLEKAARNQNPSGSKSNSDLQKQIETLQKSLTGKTQDPKSNEDLKSKLEQLRKDAKAAQNAEGGLSENSRRQLAQTLAQLSQQARDAGNALPDLDDAIAALQNEQTDHFLKELDAAMTDLEKVQEMTKTLAALQEQSARAGKDLAEQLKFGQAENARETLQKLIEQLQKQNPSPEQLKQILDEVNKAVDPAGKYGKVAEKLSAASKAMQKGDRPGGAQSLGEAAAELENLLQQMNDAQALAAALDALKQAQMSVGNCMSWGQCQSHGGVGKGGKPGSGVGTWAEETGWLYYPKQLDESWDNSGINRPDMDPRGHSDRGDGQLAEDIAPTKIRGQINPGGPMPGIMLKGVSIRGQSSVEYREAVVAAQNEAQSALNQDKVPRAYQNAVKNYFDDLKE